MLLSILALVSSQISLYELIGCEIDRLSLICELKVRVRVWVRVRVRLRLVKG